MKTIKHLMVVLTFVMTIATANATSMDSIRVDSVHFTFNSARWFVHYYNLSSTGSFRVNYGKSINDHFTSSHVISAGTDTVSVVDIGFITPSDTFLYNATLLFPIIVASPTKSFITPACGFSPNETSSAGASTCAGSSTTLSGFPNVGGETYQWKKNGIIIPGATSQTYVANATGNYLVQVTSGGCMASSPTFTFTVNPLPNIAQWLTPYVLCIGNGLTITEGGTATYTYSWSTGQTGSSIYVSPTTNTTYTVVGTDANGCTAIASPSVTVKALPLLIATSSSGLICIGSSITLNAIMTTTGVATYNWSPGNLSGSSPSDVPTTNTTYTVIGTDVNGCTGTANVNVLVSPLPVVNTGGSTTMCIGNSATLTASGATTYLWSGGQTTTSINVTPTTTTSYSVTGIDANGCANVGNGSVTVNPLPTPTITASSQSICIGKSATLIGSGGTQYSWNTGSTTTSILVSPTTSTTYSLIVTGPNGCQAATTFMLGVNGNPTASAGSNFSICTGSSETLTASGGNTYNWNTGSTATTIVVAPTTSISYTVTVTDVKSCTSTASVSGTVKAKSFFTQNLAICPGQSVTVGSNTYTVSGTYIDHLTAANGCDSMVTTNLIIKAKSFFTQTLTRCQGQSVTVGSNTYTASGTYTDILIAANGCDSVVTTNLVVYPKPIINVPPVTICAGDVATLTATGGPPYLWSSGQSTDTIMVSPTSFSDYTVTVTNANNCTSSAIATVTVISLPVPNPNSATICAGDIATLTAGGGTSYSWSDGESTAMITVAPTISSNYTVTATNAGCASSAVASVVVNADPNVIINPAASTICAGSSIVLSASGADTYLWMPSTNLSSSNISNPTATPSSTTVYTVVGKNLTTGCIGVVGTVVTVNPVPVTVVSSSSTSICANASANLIATGANYYSWSPTTGLNNTNIANPIATPNVTGIYSVTGTSLNCSSTATVSITVSSVSVTVTGGGTACFSTSVSISATSSNGNYSWSPTGGLNNSNIANPTAAPAVSTNYTVTVTDVIGCTATAIVPVTVVANNTNVTLTSSDSAICQGSIYPVTLNSNTVGGSYYGNGIVSPFSNVIDPNKVSVGPHTYTVVVTDANGCTAHATTKVPCVTAPIVTSLQWFNGANNMKNLFVTGQFSSIIQAVVKNLNGIQVYDVFSPNSNASATFHDMTVADYDEVYFQVKDVHGCSSISALFGLSVGEVQMAKIIIYPNPVVDIFYADLPEGKYEVSVCNTLGQVVRSLSVERTFSLSIGDLPVGIYTLLIRSEGYVRSAKILRVGG